MTNGKCLLFSIPKKWNLGRTGRNLVSCSLIQVSCYARITPLLVIVVATCFWCMRNISSWEMSSVDMKLPKNGVTDNTSGLMRPWSFGIKMRAYCGGQLCFTTRCGANGTQISLQLYLTSCLFFKSTILTYTYVVTNTLSLMRAISIAKYPSRR